MKTALLIIGLFILQTIYGQTPEHILKDYTLIWSDDFNGTVIDSLKWSHRAIGKRFFGIVHEDNSYLNGKGKLILEVSKKDSIYQLGHIGTQNKFSTKYGYFECRAKMNKEKGPHVAFWLQSPTIHIEKNDTKTYGTEIDIFEYHTKEGVEFVHHNLHWGGYGSNHKQEGAIVKVDKLNEGYHTFGVEWTEEEYIFYVDGKETWRTTEAVSHIPQYIILSAELTGFGGDFTNSKFPDKVIFDYVKVYKQKATINGHK